MDLNYHYQNFIDNREHHYEYYLLMEEYSHTPLFKQMIVFMNTTFPEWKTHNGVGSSAATLIYTNLMIFQDYDEDFNFEEELSSAYEFSQNSYNGFFLMKTFDYFMELLKEEDNRDDLDKLYKQFEKKLLTKEVYKFH